MAFIILPIFAFANAGVSSSGFGAGAVLSPVTLGVAAGLAVCKLVGVFGAVWLLVRFGWATLPAGAGWTQMLGTACLRGIGFTMGLFIALLALDTEGLQNEAKFGIIAGSLVSGTVGYLLLGVGAPAKV